MTESPLLRQSVIVWCEKTVWEIAASEGICGDDQSLRAMILEGQQGAKLEIGAWRRANEGADAPQSTHHGLKYVPAKYFNLGSIHSEARHTSKPCIALLLHLVL